MTQGIPIETEMSCGCKRYPDGRVRMCDYHSDPKVPKSTEEVLCAPCGKNDHLHCVKPEFVSCCCGKSKMSQYLQPLRNTNLHPQPMSIVVVTQEVINCMRCLNCGFISPIPPTSGNIPDCPRCKANQWQL